MHGFSERTNVVDVTKKYKMYIERIPLDMYVIEDLYFDNIVIWQDASGNVYRTIGNSMPEKICESFSEYISD